MGSDKVHRAFVCAQVLVQHPACTEQLQHHVDRNSGNLLAWFLSGNIIFFVFFLICTDTSRRKVLPLIPQGLQ